MYVSSSLSWSWAPSRSWTHWAFTLTKHAFYRTQKSKSLLLPNTHQQTPSIHHYLPNRQRKFSGVFHHLQWSPHRSKPKHRVQFLDVNMRCGWSHLFPKASGLQRTRDNESRNRLILQLNAFIPSVSQTNHLCSTCLFCSVASARFTAVNSDFDAVAVNISARQTNADIRFSTFTFKVHVSMFCSTA